MKYTGRPGPQFGPQLEIGDMDKKEVVVVAYVVPAGAAGRFSERLKQGMGQPQVHLETASVDEDSAVEIVEGIREGVMEEWPHLFVEGT